MAKKETDIRKTGPQSYRDLQRQNSQQFSQATDSPFINLKPSRPYVSQQQMIYEGLEQSPLQMGGEDYWGRSQYDNPVANEEEYQQEILGETRYDNQPWYDTLANGIGKMLGTAGTTFVSSLVGLPYGLVEAVGQRRWSALWDNDVTQGLADVDKWLENNMTNYRSQKQQESPWYDPANLFSMNFIADDIIKNAGFTLGAAASMAVGSGSLGLMSKSLGFVKEVSKGTKMGQAALSALFSATGEGMIEAKHGVEERNKLETQRLQDAMVPEYNALQMEFQQVEQEYVTNRGKALVRGADGNAYDPAYLIYRDKMSGLAAKRDALNKKYDAGRQQIEESGRLMGNKILLANQGLLTAGNLILFSKAMTKSFDSARHAAEMSSKYAKPFGVSATRTANETYEVTGKNLGRTIAATKGILTEGSEEMNQQWIQSSSGAAYNEEDVNDYWKAKLNPEAYRDTTRGLYTLGNILDRGFQESWGDPNQWEQFVIGGLTGMMGSYSPTKLFNQDQTKAWYDPRRYGSWEGGAVNELRNFNKEYQQYQESIDNVNKILQQEDFPARVKSMIGHTYLENQKKDAVNKNDMKAWKDADDKQTIHDMQAFLRAGRLDDLRAIYNEMAENLSDDDIENTIIKSTTKEISAEEDKRDFDASIDEQVGQHQRRITELQSRAQSIADNQEMLDPLERGQYQAAVTPQLEDIFGQIDNEYAAINSLNQQKESYTGQKRYEGSYIDDKGNRIATNDEIREQVKHNAKELNRKLDSYLESIAYVNSSTNGQLTRDQEDNLAYLHNMGKESKVRMQKIMHNVRKHLPSKFLLKTNKTPEQLTQENSSSDIVFSKDEKTKESYVEVDTSAMNDAAFADFFQRKVMRGGNIMDEFGETADEKAAREIEEENLSREEKKKKTRERASKKWKEALGQMQQDAKEQHDTNWELLLDNFMNNYKSDEGTNLGETIEAFSKLRQDLQDASDLFDQAGEYHRVLRDYMQNPTKVDETRDKEEEKIAKANTEQQQKSKFAGKSVQEINQDVSNGVIDWDELDEFASIDDVEVPNEIQDAHQNAKEAKNIRQKAASLKQSVQKQLSDAPTLEETALAGEVLKRIDAMVFEAETAADINIENPHLATPVIDWDNEEDIAGIKEYSDAEEKEMANMLAEAFNAVQQAQDIYIDMPDNSPDVSGVDPSDTGYDATTKTPPISFNPGPSASFSASDGTQNTQIVAKNTLNEGALAKIIEETKKVTNTNPNGILRSTTTRHPYHMATGTYHDDIAKPRFGENSVEYRRSKAIWEYLNSEGAFDRLDNSDADHLQPGMRIHYMVKFLPDVYGKDYKELTDQEKPFALAIIMLDDNGDVLGDLPCAQLEPSFKTGKPTQQVEELLALQNRLFESFDKDREQTGANEAIADTLLKKEGIDNLGLHYETGQLPLVGTLQQVMVGVVPFSQDERNTLNDVMGDSYEIGIKMSHGSHTIVTGTSKNNTERTPKELIRQPHIGLVGQPYLLLPTPTGEKIAVPFYMNPFDAQQHKNTRLYGKIVEALEQLMYSRNLPKDKKAEKFSTYIKQLKSFLQVEARDGVPVTDIKENTVSLHLKTLTEDRIIDIDVPFDGDFSSAARLMAEQLSGISINVKLENINSEDYNSIIGDIADINLPKNTFHTVNSWFTTVLHPTDVLDQTKNITPKRGIVVESVGTRMLEFDLDNMTIQDSNTEGGYDYKDEAANLRLAQLVSQHPVHAGKKRILVSIGGEVRTYEVEKNQFIKTLEPKSTNGIPYLGTTKLQNKTFGTEDIDPGVAELTSLQQTKQGRSVAIDTQSIPKEPAITAMTIEQIEAKYLGNNTINHRNKDAWAAISNELKLKMENEGASLVLTSGDTEVAIISKDDVNIGDKLRRVNRAAIKGGLHIFESPKPMMRGSVISLNRENEKASRSWLANNLPSLSSVERTQFVDRLARAGEYGGKMWGSYRAGVIEIQKNAPMGTVYHEAFHYVMDMILSPEERKEVLNIVMKEYGVSNEWAAEERLANDFRRYALDENTKGISGRIKRWLRKLRDRIMRYNRISDVTVNQLFWKINNGELAQRSQTIEDFEDTRQQVLEEIRNIQKEKIAWRNLNTSTQQALIDCGLSAAAYSNMSLEEKEQWLKCRI